MPAVAMAQVVRMSIFAVGVVVFVNGPPDLWRVGVIEVGAVAAMAIYYLWVQQTFITPIRLHFHVPLVKRLFVEALPIGVSRVVWALNQYLPMILVAVLMGGTEVAWFGAAHRIVTGLGAFVFLYHFNLYPQLVRTVDAPIAELETLLESSFRVTAWMGVFVGLAGMMLANPLCRLVFGDAFARAAPALSLLVWVLPVALLGAHSRYVLIAYGRQHGELVASVAGAGVTIVLGAVFIQHWGAVGAAFAMLASTFVSWGVAQALARRYVGRVPYMLPLVRPGLAALFASGLSAWLPSQSTWAAGAVALVVYVLVAPLVDPDLRRTLSVLPQRLGGRAHR
jgi:O-antigen/teichoic acid export membrane protein